jgi:Na+-transporting methylmalonyl-CoA/oxaloacetate decarboxylase gamma subunit
VGLILFLALIFVAMKVISAIINNFSYKQPPECVGVHEWVYVKELDTERLKCKNCNKYPGENNGRSDEDIY